MKQIQKFAKNTRLFGLLSVLVILLAGCRPEQLAQNLATQNWTAGQQASRLHPNANQHSGIRHESYRQGLITGSRGANVRSGPGTQHTVVGTLEKGTPVRILEQQGKWYQIEASLPRGQNQGWVYATLLQESQGSVQAPTAQQPGQQDLQSDPVHMGYSKDFLPAKQQLINGQAQLLSQQIVKRDSATGQNFWKQDDEFLHALEYGTITLDLNNKDAAIENFSLAERILEEREGGSIVGEFFQETGGWVGEIFGQGAMSPYAGEGYEKVLMLNYLSIAFLLEGERKAYNVARRSIDIQNIERKKFEIRKAKAEEKLREQEHTATNESNGIASVFDQFSNRAKDVPSAYVNPFGFYVTGMIQEYESYHERSLRENARISYEKALELNPGSTVLQQAVKDMKKSVPPAGKQLLHVVVADGFVPEKRVLQKNFYARGINVPLKLPIYYPSETQVYRLEVQTSGGRKLARLGEIADVEAICIRHQKDMEVFRNLRVALAFSSTLVEKAFLSQLGAIGNWIGDFHDTFKEPDTRSWITLPATIQATRVYLPDNLRRIKLVSYDRNNRVLAQQPLKLETGKPNFIYARSIDSVLNAYVAQEMWMQASF